MPICERAGARLHYELRGNGEPLVMLNHSGASSTGWSEAFLTALCRTRTLILTDHRGTGKSTDPGDAYEIRDLADDTAAILDHAEISTADVLGLSFGGTVAQELTLAHPKRVTRLVLVATFCGQRMSPEPEPWVVEMLQPRPGASRREEIRRTLPIYFSSAAIESMADELVAITERGTRDTPRDTLGREGRALRQFDSYEALARLDLPTLVVHGDEDVLIPPQAGVTLTERIAHAQWALLHGVGHVIPSEQPAQLAELVEAFLQQSRR